MLFIRYPGVVYLRVASLYLSFPSLIWPALPNPLFSLESVAESRPLPMPTPPLDLWCSTLLSTTQCFSLHCEQTPHPGPVSLLWPPGLMLWLLPPHSTLSPCCYPVVPCAPAMLAFCSWITPYLFAFFPLHLGFYPLISFLGPP